MSKLKAKLAKKLSLTLGEEIEPDDIDFHRGGSRTDVVRWSVHGYECFAPAYFSVKDNVEFEIAEIPQPYGCFEIYAFEI